MAGPYSVGPRAGSRSDAAPRAPHEEGQMPEDQPITNSG